MKLFLSLVLIFSSYQANAADILAPFIGNYVATQTHCDRGHGEFPGWGLSRFALSEDQNGVPTVSYALEDGRPYTETWIANTTDLGSKGTVTTSVYATSQYDAVFDEEWSHISGRFSNHSLTELKKLSDTTIEVDSVVGDTGNGAHQLYHSCQTVLQRR